jgi:hypothetical protein
LTRLPLQADLGTARREHISTADDTHRRVQAEMAVIERRRPSNVAGTKEHKQAEMNKGSLNAWTSMFQDQDHLFRKELLVR